MEEELITYPTGCLINREASEWIVCFVPALDRQWWHKLIGGDMKHCFALRYDQGSWLLFEPWWSRILLTKLAPEEYELFWRWARRGTVLKVREHVPGRSSQARGWMSCAALVAHLLGRSYQVWTPKGLYRKLMREPGCEVIYHMGGRRA